MSTSTITNRLNRGAGKRSSAPTGQPNGAARGGKQRPKDLSTANFFFIIYAVVCFLTVIWHCGGFNQHAGTSFIWALACTTVGGAFGFLFGIPKILQSDRLPEDASSAVLGYRQQVNTNLTEISDWLTKIIVGLSLIHLAKFPPYLTSMAQTLATSIDANTPAPHMAFAYALIVCFSILGFLFGYLFTRLFLQGAFSRADQEAANSKQAETEARFEGLAEQTEARVGLLEAQMGTRPKPIVAEKGIQPSATAVPKRDDGTAAVAATAAESEALAQLRRMADEYLNVYVADRDERLRLKNESAKNLFNYVLTNKISKDLLLREAERAGHEGLSLALAQYILSYPEPGDLERLLRVAPAVRRWHVQYKTIHAIGQLFEKHCATAEDREAALNVLRRYEQNADTSLLRLIQGTRSLIERNTQPEAVMVS